LEKLTAQKAVFMLEKFRQFRSDLRRERDTAAGALMIFEILQAKKQVKAEETYATRIEAAIILREIQFVSRFPFDPPEEPIDIRLAKFAEFENKGYAVLLVIKPEWLREVLRSGNPREKDYFYEKLKLTLQVIDELRGEGDRVLTEGEIQGTTKEQRKQK